MGLELLLQAAKHIENAKTEPDNETLIAVGPFQHHLNTDHNYNFSAASNYIQLTSAVESEPELTMPAEIRKSPAFANPYPARITSTSFIRLQPGTNFDTALGKIHYWPYSHKKEARAQQKLSTITPKLYFLNKFPPMKALDTGHTGSPQKVTVSERHQVAEKSRRAHEANLLERLRLILHETRRYGRQVSKRELLQTSVRHIKILELRNKELGQEMVQLCDKGIYLRNRLSSLLGLISDEARGATPNAVILASKITDINGNDVSFHGYEAGIHVPFGEINFAQHPTSNQQ